MGNAVGTHDDLRELVALTAAGGVSCVPGTTRWKLSPTPSPISRRANARPGRARAVTLLIPSTECTAGDDGTDHLGVHAGVQRCLNDNTQTTS